VTGSSVLSKEVQVPCPPKQYGGPSKCFTKPEHAFFWSAGTMTDLGTLGGLDSQGVAIGDSGEVVGWSAPKSGGRGDAFVSNGHNMTAVSGMAPDDARDQRLRPDRRSVRRHHQPRSLRLRGR
jgi:probable HAF family extracellular repeat protein